VTEKVKIGVPELVVEPFTRTVGPKEEGVFGD
jgi:hypothetical protein